MDFEYHIFFLAGIPIFGAQYSVCHPDVCVDCLGRSLWMGQMEFCPFITKIGHGKYGAQAGEGESCSSMPSGYQKVARIIYPETEILN